MTDSNQPKQPKGDPNKQFDVTISVIHDNRKGVSRPVEKSVRSSFETEEQALEFANKLKEVK